MRSRALLTLAVVLVFSAAYFWVEDLAQGRLGSLSADEIPNRPRGLQNEQARGGDGDAGRGRDHPSREVLADLRVLWERHARELDRIAKRVEDQSDQIAVAHGLSTMEQVLGPASASLEIGPMITEDEIFSRRVALDRLTRALGGTSFFFPDDRALELATTLRGAALGYRKEAYAYFRAARGDYRAMWELEGERARHFLQRDMNIDRDLTLRIKRLESLPAAFGLGFLGRGQARARANGGASDRSKEDRPKRRVQVKPKSEPSPEEALSRFQKIWRGRDKQWTWRADEMERHLRSLAVFPGVAEIKPAGDDPLASLEIGYPPEAEDDPVALANFIHETVHRYRAEAAVYRAAAQGDLEPLRKWEDRRLRDAEAEAADLIRDAQRQARLLEPPRP